MSKQWTKTLGMVCMIILATASFTFADETEVKPFYDRMVTVLENHYPEMLDQWVEKFEEHKTLHEDLEALKETLRTNIETARAEIKAELEAKKAELKTSVESGDMTLEEAREAFSEFIEPYKETKELNLEKRTQMKEAFEEIKEKISANKEERISVRQELRAALIAEEDDAVIQSLITQLMALQEIHLGYDYEKFNLLNEL